jgi:hypothetical protein
MSDCTSTQSVECDLLENGYTFTKLDTLTNTGVARFDLMFIQRPIMSMYWEIHTGQEIKYVRFKVKSKSTNHDVKRDSNDFNAFHFTTCILCDSTSYVQLEFGCKSECRVDLYIVF